MVFLRVFMSQWFKIGFKDSRFIVNLQKPAFRKIALFILTFITPKIDRYKIHKSCKTK